MTVETGLFQVLQQKKLMAVFKITPYEAQSVSLQFNVSHEKCQVLYEVL
jgi:hypothetical protein